MINEKEQLLLSVKLDFEKRIKNTEQNILITTNCVSHLESIINHLSQAFKNTYNDKQNKERKITDSELNYIHEVFNTTLNFLVSDFEHKKIDIHRAEGKRLQAIEAISLLESQISTLKHAEEYQKKSQEIDKKTRKAKQPKKNKTIKK